MKLECPNIQNSKSETTITIKEEVNKENIFSFNKWVHSKHTTPADTMMRISQDNSNQVNLAMAITSIPTTQEH